MQYLHTNAYEQNHAFTAGQPSAGHWVRWLLTMMHTCFNLLFSAQLKLLCMKQECLNGTDPLLQCCKIVSHTKLHVTISTPRLLASGGIIKLTGCVGGWLIMPLYCKWFISIYKRPKFQILHVERLWLVIGLCSCILNLKVNVFFTQNKKRKTHHSPCLAQKSQSCAEVLSDKVILHLFNNLTGTHSSFIYDGAGPFIAL